MSGVNWSKKSDVDKLKKRIEEANMKNMKEKTGVLSIIAYGPDFLPEHYTCSTSRAENIDRSFHWNVFYAKTQSDIDRFVLEHKHEHEMGLKRCEDFLSRFDKPSNDDPFVQEQRNEKKHHENALKVYSIGYMFEKY